MAAVVNPAAGVLVPVRLRGLRCDAKAGISFRGTPTGLAVGFGRNGRLPYGPGEDRPDSPRLCLMSGSPVPKLLREGRGFGAAARLAWFAEGGTGCLGEHASQSVALL
ncbi:hypothetical protein SCWH03_23050 [Streptomyces pacificus]|uniref:Uncharacterized protein n=1 Tax=Streptomyces pacificus TaxID=2705029 RepID=A0A6A0AUT8_9ACTN|nr:hypothetical protein SCWH03_23050 [Streptomyces pacificus]